MAVYTKISNEDLENFLSNYRIGKLKSFQGIVEGIENTIYLLLTSSGKYILTLYEKRVREEDLPFFMNLLSSLSDQKFKCPKPIKDQKGIYINRIKGKNASLVSYIEGKSKKNLTALDCKDIGKMAANIHLLGKKITAARGVDPILAGTRARTVGPSDRHRPPERARQVADGRTASAVPPRSPRGRCGRGGNREEDRGEIPEQSNLSYTQPRQEPTTHQASPGNQVIVTEIRMQFGSMVVFMVKWAIASIPAMIILFLAGVVILGLLGGYVGIVR